MLLISVSLFVSKLTNFLEDGSNEVNTASGRWLKQYWFEKNSHFSECPYCVNKCLNFFANKNQKSKKQIFSILKGKTVEESVYKSDQKCIHFLAR